MALTPKNNHGVTNGTTAVVLVAAPGATEYHIVKHITVFNADTAACTFELLLVDGGTTRVIERSAAIAANGNYSFTQSLCLDATTKSLKLRLIAAKTTNDCDFTSHYVTEA